MKRAKTGWWALAGATGQQWAGRSTDAARRMMLAVVAGTFVATSVASIPSPAAALERMTLTAPGAPEDLVETLRLSSLLLVSRDEGHVDTSSLMATARAEYGRLIPLLYDHGYYAPTISVLIDGREASEISPLSTPAQIDRVEVIVTTGPLFTFGRVEIDPLAPDTVLPEGFASGQPARSTMVRAALAEALDAWRGLGHAQADVQAQDVVANHNTAELNVRLSLAPGPRLRFGAVVPQGNERTRSNRIIAIAGLPRGETHDPEAMDEGQTRLRDTGAFSSVVLRTAERANPDGSIDIEAQVVEAPPRRLGFGVEYDSESGVQLTGFWLHRNFLGGAERLRLEASIDGIAARTGGLGVTLDARYTRPATINRDTDLELGTRVMRLDERDYMADAFEADAALVRRFGDNLLASGGVQLRYERAEYGGTSSNFGTLGLPLSLTYDSRDTPLNATEGHYLSATIMPYFGFGQTEHGARLRFDARSYTDFGSEGRVVLAGRAQVGAIVGSALNATPRGFLFYSGGGGTVRGLPFQSLGVAGPPASGGRGLVTASGELRVRVNDSLTLATFADAGWVSAGPLRGASDWQAGGGVGLRYDTPIGPLRLDLATPLRRNASALGSSSYQIYLGIGQAF
ncbi:autotransporter assembly complex protein TamA [Pararhodobacter oceanensis]|uniref:autotransporter assembly complex protein TamA n=1 Tax=Pararhodobacter oceanensis TaxID=2172121 RepID=UPI003A91A94E